MTSSPAAPAAAMTSAGESEPSDALLGVCRSMRIMRLSPAPPAGAELMRSHDFALVSAWAIYESMTRFSSPLIGPVHAVEDEERSDDSPLVPPRGPPESGLLSEVCSSLVRFRFAPCP